MIPKSFIRRFSICAALVFIIFTSACVAGPKVKTYTADKLQQSEVAVIKGWCFYALGYQCIEIYGVDGNPLEATNVEVLPGMHELQIRWFTVSLLLGDSPRTARVELNFEPGHEYEIKARFEGISPKGADIVDVTTGTKITQLWY